MHSEHRELGRLARALDERVDRTIANRDLESRDDSGIDPQPHTGDTDLATALLDRFRGQRRIELRGVASDPKHEAAAGLRVGDRRDVGGRAHGRFVDRDDAVARLETGACRGLVRQHLIDERRSEISLESENRKCAALPIGRLDAGQRHRVRRSLSARFGALDGDLRRILPLRLDQSPAELLPACDRLAVDFDDQVAGA